MRKRHRLVVSQKKQNQGNRDKSMKTSVSADLHTFLKRPHLWCPGGATWVEDHTEHHGPWDNICNSNIPVQYTFKDQSFASWPDITKPPKELSKCGPKGWRYWANTFLMGIRHITSGRGSWDISSVISEADYHVEELKTPANTCQSLFYQKLNGTLPTDP